MALEIFFSYSHKDEALREQLEKHLNLLKLQGLISNWHDREISAGSAWEREIDTHISTADIILLLISPDFMNSSYCKSIEVKRAMERHEAEEALVIPVILRYADWETSPFGKLQALPADGRPIKNWKDRDKAFLDVTRGIRKVIEKRSINSYRNSATSSTSSTSSSRRHGLIGLLPLTDPRIISQRESMVKEIYTQLTQPGVSTVILTGLDGTGKSTLAALVFNYARERQHAGEGFFTAEPVWIKIDPTVTMIDLATTLFKALGKPLPDFGRFSPEHQAVTLFQALDKTNRSLLIILDEFDHLLDVKGHTLENRPGLGEWLDALNTRPCRCRILVTSRQLPHNFTSPIVKEYNLQEHWDEACGIDMLRKQGVEASEADLHTAVHKCGGIALALKLLVAELSNRKSSLQAFLKDSKSTQFWQGSVAYNLVDSIYQEYLDESQRSLLGAFSVYREAVVLDAAQAILEERSRFSDYQVQTALEVLLRQNLLQAAGEGLFQVQILISNYMQTQMMKGEEQFNLQTAHYEAAKYYLQQAALFDPSIEKPKDVDDLHHLIEAVWHLCHAEHWTEAYTILFQEGLYTYLKLWGKYEILLELILLFSTNKWHPDQSQEANIYNSMGMVYNSLGRMKDALHNYQKALEIVKKQGDTQEEGVTLRHIGRVYNALGKKKEALEFFKQALDILIDGNSPIEVGITYERLGRVYNVLGQKEKAVDAYQKALGIYKEVRDNSGEGTTLSYLGRVYSTLGKEEQGLKLCRQGVDILRRIGDRRGEGRALDNLGSIYHVLKQPDKALVTYEAALKVAKQIGDIGGQGIVLQGLGNVYITRGQKEAAQKMYEQALSVLREVGDKWREGMVLSSLANLSADAAQKEMTLKYCREAIFVHREVENFEGEGMTLYNLGKFYVTQKDYEIALACLLSARTVLEKGHYQGQIIQQTIEDLQTSIGEEQFTALLKRSEPQAAQLVDMALLEITWDI